MKDCLRYFIAFILFQILFGTICTPIVKTFGFTDKTQAMTMQLLLASATSSIATIALFVWRKWWKIKFDYLRTRPYKAMAITTLLAFATLLPTVWFEELLPQEMTKDLMEDVFKMVLSRPEGFMFIAVLAPIVEEIVFRGAILRRLLLWSEEKTEGNPDAKSRAAWMAIVISALYFSVVHMNPAQMPHAFLIGLLLGWLYYRTNSIVLCVILHFVNNSTAFLACYLMPDIPYDAESIVLFNYNYPLYYTSLTASVIVAVACIAKLNASLSKHEL
ncbi:MAG: CPBP family intramembrane metalloprotease [Prevotella sp.]|nr:CPBP family intramembrane metalloprotease [Prevotella sp.]